MCNADCHSFFFNTFIIEGMVLVVLRYLIIVNICFFVYGIILAIENDSILGTVFLILFSVAFGLALQGVLAISVKFLAKELDFKQSLEVINKGYLMMVPFLGISIMAPIFLGGETILPVTTASIMAGATGSSIELSLKGVKGKLPFMAIIVIGFTFSTTWVLIINLINIATGNSIT